MTSNSWSQVQNIPLNFTLNQELNIHENNNSESFHSSIKPYCRQFVDDKSFDFTFKDTSKHYYDLTVFLYKRSLLEIEKNDVKISGDILLDLALGQSDESGRSGNKRIYYNTRGFRIAGDLGSNVSFETRFYETQLFYPRYLDSIATSRGIAFGQGRTKPFKIGGLDVGSSSGYVSIKAHETVNVQFGHDKLFIGNGYRSLFLSDNSSNYPMLRVMFQSKNKKWMFQNVNAWMQSLKRLPVTSSAEALFKRKGASFRYLSFKPTSKLEIGLFEGVIYKSYDDSIGMTPLNYSFYVPIIGFSTAINGLQNANNSLIGLNASYKFSKFNIFGQLAIDDLDKIGYQIGGNWYEPFGWKKNWFHAEFNSASQYMYSHNSDNILQNYSHNNQELAHPIGGSFHELLAIYHFEKNKWFVDAEIAFSKRIRYNGSTRGENVLLANDPIIALVYIEDPISTTYWKLEVGHNFNLKTRMQAFIGIYNRNLTNKNYKIASQSEFYYTIGLRMNLNNFYYDI